MFFEYFQYNSHMFCMLLLILGVNEDVIYEHHHKLVQIGAENPVDIIHEDRWSISHPKWHYYIHVM